MKRCKYQKWGQGTFLAVQWLRLPASTTGVMGSIPDHGTRIPHASNPSINQSIDANVRACSLSHVRLFATPWTVAHQGPLSVESSRQEYWSGLQILIYIVVVQSLSRVWVFETSWTQLQHASPPRLLLSPSLNLLKPMCIESVMLASHLILCCNSFRWTVKGFSHTYTCFHSPPSSSLIQAAIGNWAEFPELYNRSSLVIHLKYSSVYMSIPNSLTIPPPNLPPGNHKFIL